MQAARFKVLLVLLSVTALLLLPQTAAAHCDSVDGPVVTVAKAALEKGDVTPVLKWVRLADEPEVRAAFARTLKVRALNPEAREVADNYFFETLVRIHRAAEGEPYTGLKPAGSAIDAGIEQADEALASGSADELVKQLTAAVANGIRQRFARTQEASRHSDQSVEGGRQYVAAYVEYIHYVERMHQAAAEGASHAAEQHEARMH